MGIIHILSFSSMVSVWWWYQFSITFCTSEDPSSKELNILFKCEPLECLCKKRYSILRGSGGLREIETQNNLKISPTKVWKLNHSDFTT